MKWQGVLCFPNLNSMATFYHCKNLYLHIYKLLGTGTKYSSGTSNMSVLLLQPLHKGTIYQVLSELHAFCTWAPTIASSKQSEDLQYVGISPVCAFQYANQES